MVAVKLIPKSFKYCQLVYDHETSILKDLAHPNIVSLVDAFETQEDYVLVAKYLRGGAMMSRLRALHHYSERVCSYIS
jgi:serine/threonine protein kinase